MLLITDYSSTIIEDILRHCQSDPTFVVVYFYFDFSDTLKQSSDSLIRSLITQMSSQSSSCPEALKSLYSQNLNGQRQPTTEDFMVTLKCIVGSFQHVYVIIDALDECQDREQLLPLIEEISEWKSGNLHMLATSRQEHDIEVCVGPLVSAQINLHSVQVNADIHTHLRERLQNDSKLKKWPAKIHGQIEEALMDGAHGM
jgi:hypothetical protein